MREDLQKIDGLRKEFKGTFVRFGKKTSFQWHSKPTVLLSDITCTTNPKIKCDHLWFNLTKEFGKLDLKKGDVLSFHARVKEYYKGYQGHREEWENSIEKDYKLSHPTKIKRVKT